MGGIDQTLGYGQWSSSSVDVDDAYLVERLLRSERGSSKILDPTTGKPNRIINRILASSTATDPATGEILQAEIAAYSPAQRTLATWLPAAKQSSSGRLRPDSDSLLCQLQPTLSPTLKSPRSCTT